MFSSAILHAVFLLLLADMLVVDSKVRGNPNRNRVASVNRGRIWGEDEDAPPPRGPHFAKDSPKSVTAAVGAPAHIPCKARNLGAKSLFGPYRTVVSWIRHRDLHVLTVGSFTFTNDERFSAHRDPSSGDWVLVLRHPQPSDSGYYECSISTKPVTAISVKLEVVVPSAELLGDGSVYLDKGSALNLTCVVHFSPTPPEFILWYHREKLVNYGTKGGREIRVNTVHTGEMTKSSLLIQNATLWDSGKYSCKPANANKVSVVVYVLESETPEAMKTTTNGGAPYASSTNNALLIMSTLAAVAAASTSYSSSSSPLNHLTVTAAAAAAAAISPSSYFFSYISLTASAVATAFISSPFFSCFLLTAAFAAAASFSFFFSNLPLSVPATVASVSSSFFSHPLLFFPLKGKYFGFWKSTRWCLVPLVFPPQFLSLFTYR